MDPERNVPPRWVVVWVDNDGGQPAEIFWSVESAKKRILASLLDPSNDPPFNEAEIARIKHETNELTGEHVQSVQGSSAWKEWIHIAPLSEGDE